MKSLTGPIIKSLIFIAVTVFATAMLALTIINGAVGGANYKAIFTDVTSLNSGDDVRMAGVRVGQVQSVSIYHHDEAKVTFSVESDVKLAQTTTAIIRYRNMIGQRYIELDEGNGSLSDPMKADSTIPQSRTQPALDLTALFNGFQPLFQALSPTQINTLSGEIINVFQGQGTSIAELLQDTGQLTKALADKDSVIKAVIDNLNSVVAAVNGHGNQLSNLISTLSEFVSGLAEDRNSLGQALTGIAGLTTDVASLVQQGRPAIKESITALGQVSQNLAGSSGALNSFLETFPTKLNNIGRVASYGSWLNFYVCTIGGNIPVPGYNSGPPSGTTGGSAYGELGANGVTPKNDVGVDNPAARCSA